MNRSIKTIIPQWVVHGYFLFTFGLHLYTCIMLAIQDVVRELIIPSLLFIFLVLFAFEGLIIAGKKRNVPMMSWVGTVGGLGFSIMDWFWYEGALGDLDYLFQIWPVTIIIYVFWVIPLGIASLFTLIQGISSMISLYRNKFDFKTHNNASTRKRLVSSGLMIGLVTLALFSPGIVNAIARFDHVTRYIELEDTNMECNFAVWNDFNLPSDQYQLGSTRDLDLTSLSPENNRTLIALGKMNTTFYTQENLNSPSAINRTIAYLKLLDLYNITVMQTIWYSSEIDENFPKPYYPEDWIKNARTALEKIIEYNITNIIGICADSEGSAERLSAEEYFQNIEMYEDFLKEVQTNSSLAHPSPYQDTFQTVLTIEPRYLQDRLDGVDDTDIMDFRRMWGGMEWTDYHFMLYRTNLDASPTEMYNYLTHIKNTIGVERGAPICGITGVRWFAEGFFAGTAQDFKGGQPDFTLDGVDGWEGMKREILFSKAMGFHTVSLFKLHANDDPLKVEGYGLNETYGLEAIEDLAEVWNQPKIIKYPLNYMKIEYGQRGLYPANHEFRYDLFLNPEVAVFQGIILIAVVICIFFKAKRRNIQS